jgi:hypothetical protein
MSLWEVRAYFEFFIRKLCENGVFKNSDLWRGDVPLGIYICFEYIYRTGITNQNNLLIARQVIKTGIPSFIIVTKHNSLRFLHQNLSNFMPAKSLTTVIISFRRNIMYFYLIWSSLNWSFLYANDPGCKKW